MIYIETFIHFENEEEENHRVNGPAFIGKFRQSWYKNGKRHRLDGPAVINGKYQAWYIEGEEYTESAYHKKLKEMGLE